MVVDFRVGHRAGSFLEAFANARLALYALLFAISGAPLDRYTVSWFLPVATVNWPDQMQSTHELCPRNPVAQK